MPQLTDRQALSRYCDMIEARNERLEAALRTILPLAEHFPCGVEGSEGAREMQKLCVKIAAEARSALERN